MKIIHSTILALAIGAASITGAQARDSFSFGFSSGGAYLPPVTFYNPPVVYYSAAPTYYNRGYYNNAPVVIYRNNDDGFRGCRRGGGHEEHEHHGWGHEEREHIGWNQGGWGRGHHDDDDDD